MTISGMESVLSTFSDSAHLTLYLKGRSEKRRDSIGKIKARYLFKTFGDIDYPVLFYLSFFKTKRHPTKVMST